MSILVKGMRKPQSCEQCVLCLDDSRICNGYCMIFHRRVDMETLDADCPIVEVPPHGRLIDKDALLAQFREMSLDDLSLAEDFIEHGVDDAIDDAPTIIEAEEET